MRPLPLNERQRTCGHPKVVEHRFNRSHFVGNKGSTTPEESDLVDVVPQCELCKVLFPRRVENNEGKVVEGER